MNAITANRRPYLSKRVREGLRTILDRTSAETIEEAMALFWIEGMLAAATIAAPQAHDAQSPGDEAGGVTPSGLSGDGKEAP